MKKLILLTCSFIITPLTLAVCILFYSYLNHSSAQELSRDTYSPQVAFAALPGTENVTEDTTFQKDARIESVRQFMKRYNSDLEEYAANIVTAADKYGLDYRFLPAIGMQESNLCKKAPENSYNCWGFGIYAGKVLRFDGYAEAIDTVTKTLANDYKAKGLHTAEEIMAKYTPSNEGEWADSVNYFMNQL